MQQQQRKLLHSTLANSDLEDIRDCWGQSPEDFEFEILRTPETGMVMALGRAEGTGEPFNLGEVTVTRCALRLASGETGIGYVKGRSKQHALYIAALDALAQQSENYQQLYRQVIEPLQRKLTQRRRQQARTAESTRVDFLTMVRGESE